MPEELLELKTAKRSNPVFNAPPGIDLMAEILGELSDNTLESLGKTLTTLDL